MLFQWQWEEAQSLCLDISVWGVMNFSWNTKVSARSRTRTRTQSSWVILWALFGYIYSWKRQTARPCVQFYRGTVYILTHCFSFTALRGCFLSKTPVQLITLCVCLRLSFFFPSPETETIHHCRVLSRDCIAQFLKCHSVFFSVKQTAVITDFKGLFKRTFHMPTLRCVRQKHIVRLLRKATHVAVRQDDTLTHPVWNSWHLSEHLRRSQVGGDCCYRTALRFLCQSWSNIWEQLLNKANLWSQRLSLKLSLWHRRAKFLLFICWLPQSRQTEVEVGEGTECDRNEKSHLVTISFWQDNFIDVHWQFQWM